MTDNPKITTSVAKGALIGFVLVAFSLVVQLTMNMQDAQKIGWISFVILFAGIIGSCVHYAKQMEGAVTFGSVFAYGFKVTALVTLITTIFTYLSVKFIFPEMEDKTIEAAQQQMASQGKMTEEQIEQALGMTRKYFAVFVVGGSLIMYIFLGAIASLIGAAVAKKDPNALASREINELGA